jgi:hypothetical protein
VPMREGTIDTSSTSRRVASSSREARPSTVADRGGQVGAGGQQLGNGLSRLRSISRSPPFVRICWPV